MESLLYPLIASIIGVGFAAFLTLKVQRVILKQGFMKSIYDECSVATQMASQGITSTTANLTGFSVIANRIGIIAKRFSSDLSDKETNAIVQNMEQVRADYIHSVRADIHASAESFAELHRKMSTYDFAFVKAKPVFQKLTQDYEAYISDQDEILNDVSTIELSGFIRINDVQADFEGKMRQIDAKTKSLVSACDKLQICLQQDLIGKLFARH